MDFVLGDLNLNESEQILNASDDIFENPTGMIGNVLNSPLFLLSFIITVLIWIIVYSYDYYNVFLTDYQMADISYKCPDFWTSEDTNKQGIVNCKPPSGFIPQPSCPTGTIQVSTDNKNEYTKIIGSSVASKNEWTKQCGPWGSVKTIIN